jgi:N-acetylneuraminic acid mutarotase
VAPPPVPISTSSVVPLADGRIVFLGGFIQQTGQATSQVLIFDPAQNTWSQGAAMPEPIGFGAVAARLLDGTVLVAGGSGPNGLIGDSWLYEPGHNSWSRVGKMRVPRDQASFIVMTDGRVLVAGGSVPLDQPIQLSNGETINEKAVAATELFDPATRTWSLAGQLNPSSTYLTLVALPHAGALAAGGCAGYGYSGAIQAGTGAASSLAELFDPATLAWNSTTPMPEPRCGASAVSLPDGRAFLAGGDQGTAPTAVIFDPASRHWTPVGPAGGTPIVLADGRVLIPGFQTGPQQGRVGTEFVGGQVFDPATGGWTFTTTTSVPVSSFLLAQGLNPVAVALPNGDAIVVLGTAALAFHPGNAPPATQVLESTGLMMLLLGLAAILGTLLLVAYVLARRRGRLLIAG